MSTLSAAAPGARVTLATERPLAKWGPLAGLLILGAALRLSTLGLQSFWYDEAFTPVHVLHHGLAATMRSVAHTENSPPLWYLVAWLDVRVLGDGAVALRLPSALAGIGTIAVAWPIGEELGGRLCALVSAALVAVNPLFFWYSQEARTYALFVLASALSLLFFLRARRLRTGRTMAAFALSGALALLTHYFAVFLVVPMAAVLVAERATRRAALPAVAALACLGGALVPLLAAQGGHGTQWIGRWALSSRLQAIPQYYLTGYSGAPLGHGIELLVALPILAGAALGARRLLLSPEGQAARLVAAPAAAVARGAGGAPRRRAGGGRHPRADPPRGGRRRLPGAAKPGGRDGPADGCHRLPVRARCGAGRLRPCGGPRGRLPGGVRGRGPQPTAAARQLARPGARARRRPARGGDHDG